MNNRDVPPGYWSSMPWEFLYAETAAILRSDDYVRVNEYIWFRPFALYGYRFPMPSSEFQLKLFRLGWLPREPRGNVHPNGSKLNTAPGRHMCVFVPPTEALREKGLLAD